MRSPRRRSSSAAEAALPVGAGARRPAGDDPDPPPPLPRRRGRGRCLLSAAHDILQVPIEDVFLAVGQLQELLPGTAEPPLPPVEAHLAEPELNRVPPPPPAPPHPPPPHPPPSSPH